MMPNRPTRRTGAIAALSICLSLLLSSCGPATPRPRRATEADKRHLNEGRAHKLVIETLEQNGVAYEPRWSADIGADEPLEVDLRLEGTHYGIEWVSPQDRQDYGEAIPRPDPDGLLRILPGAGEDAQVQILVLDYEAYRYDPDPDRVRAGATSVRDVEGRLQRDVRDFLVHIDRL